MPDLLENYHRLLNKVDELCKGITCLLGDALVCRPSCSSCCIPISVFPVEVAALVEATGSLSSGQYLLLKKQLSLTRDDDKCPLLFEDQCLLYKARPIICRTHGLPVMITEGDGQRRVDVCPLNCKEFKQLPGNAIIDLEQLNTLLFSINVLYLKDVGRNLPDRIPLWSLGEMLP